jgi:paraquat-inducible protein B
MSESNQHPPAAKVTTKRRLSAVWIAPVIAAIAVGYLLYDGVRSRGPLVTIVFDNAEGIVAGKSPLKYEGVKVGTVKAVAADPANGRVTVTARLTASASPLAVAGSQFWIQYPRIGLSGIGALDTLISGPYIACLPGSGEVASDFAGLQGRPPVPQSTPGLRIVLRAETVGSLYPGTRVMFRGLNVGEVDRIQVSAADEPVQVNIFIDEEHRNLITSGSYFWEISGLHASFRLGEGLRVDTKSVRSILDGGVAFHSPPGSGASPPVNDGEEFVLHRHPDVNMHNATPISITFSDGSGVEPGQTEIRHDGVTIGLVTALAFSPTFDGVHVSALLNAAGKPLAVAGSSFWIARPEIGLGGVRGLDTLINGVYIDCMPGDGAHESDFVGLEARPAGDPRGPGLNVVLQAEATGSIRPGSPVYYREIVVGEILGVSLSEDASHVAIRAHIKPGFEPLVRQHTVFWNASGIEIQGGLAGFEIKSESLESILAGGVAFATPDAHAMGEPARDGDIFPLHKEPQGRWLQWKPSIPLTPGGS